MDNLKKVTLKIYRIDQFLQNNRKITLITNSTSINTSFYQYIHNLVINIIKSNKKTIIINLKYDSHIKYLFKLVQKH